MWGPLNDFVMTYLDPVGVVVGVLIAVPVILTWWEVTLGRRRQQRRWFREIRRRPGERPSILILDLLAGKDIRASVEHFRQRQRGLSAIPDERIFCLARTKPLTPEQMPALHEELRALAARIITSGTDTLHYFHAGPACAAALVGAELANACRVILYQHSVEHGTYVNMGPLKALAMGSESS
jgi:hypothetical protein